MKEETMATLVKVTLVKQAVFLVSKQSEHERKLHRASLLRLKVPMS